MSHLKDFCKIIKKDFNNFSDFQVFDDFLTAAAISIRQPFEKDPENEKEYFKTIEKYSTNQICKLPQLLAITVLALEESPQDFLGGVFHELELHNRYKGQFFTPYHVCLMMAKMTYSKPDFEAIIREKGFVTFSEPACGAGAMLIAVGHVFTEHGFNRSKELLFHAQDIDGRACKMAYIQLSLMGMPGIVQWGNTLSQENFDRPWKTPLYHFEVGAAPETKEARVEIPAIQTGKAEKMRQSLKQGFLFSEADFNLKGTNN